MNMWVTITSGNLAEIFAQSERKLLSAPENESYVSESILDVIAEVREAVANNAANRLDPDMSTIPRTLKTAALDILAVRLLKRFSLEITEPRKQAAADALKKLQDVAAARWKITDPDGNVPTDPADLPVIISPSPAYGNDGTGFYPEPLA